MFKVGDMVEIVMPPYPVYQRSAVDNLVGTIAKIIKIEKRSYHVPRNVYKLELIEIHLKYPDLFEDDYGNYAWQDQHLKLINDYDPKVEIKETDVMDVFGGIYG